MGRLMVLIVVIAFIASCKKKVVVSVEELMDKSFQQKVERFKKKKREDCAAELMHDAEELVDSIIAEQLNLDTISFPVKPIKPNAPKLKDLPVELELKPIGK